MEQTEARIQSDMVTHIWNTYPQTRGLLIHVPNGGLKSKRESAQLKAMGLTAGVSDLIFFWGGTTYFFEVKTPTGRQSPVQKDFEFLITEHLFSYYVVRTVGEIDNIISLILKK